MKKAKPFVMRITRNQLREIAIQSVSVKQNLDDFWAYVHAAQTSGLLDMRDWQVKQWLGSQEDLIYGLGFKREEAVEMLSDRVQHEEIIPNQSGITDDRPVSPKSAAAIRLAMIDPEAVKKAKLLVRDVAARYGWSATGINSSGEPTIFHHWELDLHVYASKRPELHVMGRNGIDTPCVEYEQYMQLTSYKEDAVASLLVTCVADLAMAQHITSFCPEFMERWERYQAKLKSKNSVPNRGSLA